MPRKKLTKAQVKRALKTSHAHLFRLFMDKIEQPDSRVPMSKDKLMDLVTMLGNAWKRVK